MKDIEILLDVLRKAKEVKINTSRDKIVFSILETKGDQDGRY